VMLQALEKEASRRQPSMRGFAAALEQLGGGESAAPPVQVSIPGGAAVGPVATADTVLSTSPPFTGSREVTPLEAAATLGGGTEPMMQVAPAPARQRTVAMWIAAALAAGMAGFFVVARVDERGADRPPPSRSTSGPSGAAPDREGPQVDPGSSVDMGSGGGGTPVPGIASHADHAIAPPEPLPDAGVGLAVETAEELDAGAKNAVKKIVKKVKRPGPKNATEPLGDEQQRQAPIQQENAPIQQRNVDPSEREATVE
jgi:hypothetical protein